MGLGILRNGVEARSAARTWDGATLLTVGFNAAIEGCVVLRVGLMEAESGFQIGVEIGRASCRERV